MNTTDTDRAIEELEAGLFEGETFELRLLNRDGSVYNPISSEMQVTLAHVPALVLATIGILMLTYGLVEPVVSMYLR